MMLRTLDYGTIPVVEKNVIRQPYDTFVDTIETNCDFYDIFAIAEDGSLVAVLDDCL